MADWDGFADEYDDVFLKSRLYSDTLDAIAGAALGGGRKEFLDLGCGTGNLSARLMAADPDISIMGVDPARGMRERCSLKFAGNARYRVAGGDALSIPAPDRAFDAVVSNLALHHVPPGRRPDCARELARVLKPGGLLVYGDLFSDVDAAEDHAGWTRDTIEKHLAMSLYCLEHDACEKMMVLLEALPRTLRRDGEYLSTDAAWVRELERAGFTGLSVKAVSPPECGNRIIRGALNPGIR